MRMDMCMRYVSLFLSLLSLLLSCEGADRAPYYLASYALSQVLVKLLFAVYMYMYIEYINRFVIVLYWWWDEFSLCGGANHNQRL
jgi:hypothetical protein